MVECSAHAAPFDDGRAATATRSCEGSACAAWSQVLGEETKTLGEKRFAELSIKLDAFIAVAERTLDALNGTAEKGIGKSNKVVQWEASEMVVQVQALQQLTETGETMQQGFMFNETEVEVKAENSLAEHWRAQYLESSSSLQEMAKELQKWKDRASAAEVQAAFWKAHVLQNFKALLVRKVESQRAQSRAATPEKAMVEKTTPAPAKASPQSGWAAEVERQLDEMQRQLKEMPKGRARTPARDRTPARVAEVEKDSTTKDSQQAATAAELGRHQQQPQANLEEVSDGREEAQATAAAAINVFAAENAQQWTEAPELECRQQAHARLQEVSKDEEDAQVRAAEQALDDEQAQLLAYAAELGRQQHEQPQPNLGGLSKARDEAQAMAAAAETGSTVKDPQPSAQTTELQRQQQAAHAKLKEIYKRREKSPVKAAGGEDAVAAKTFQALARAVDLERQRS